LKEEIMQRKEWQDAILILGTIIFLMIKIIYILNI
jgi:hypothetical protein